MARRYLIIFAGSVVVLALALAGMIRAADPYYLVDAPLIEGFNVLKPEAARHQVESKRSLFLRRPFETMVLGNSRVDMGFNPRSENWPARRFGQTFNFGLPGLSMEACIANYYFAAANGVEPKTVVLVVDFYDHIAGDAPGPVVVGDAEPDAWLETGFSLAAMVDTVKTIRAQYAAYPAHMETTGFNPGMPFLGMIGIEGQYSIFQQKNADLIETYSGLKRRRDTKDIGMSFDLANLTRLASDLADADVDLYVVIPPYHIDLHTVIDTVGLGALFEAWKEAVVSAVAAGSDRAEVWDFAQVTSVSAEAVPPPGDTTTVMQWYWDSGHFRQSLGDLVGCRLAGGSCDYTIGYRAYPASGDRPPLSRPPVNLQAESEARINAVR